MRILRYCVALSCLALAQGALSQTQNYGQLGTVNVLTECQPEAQKHIVRGVALLHHMTYEEAEIAFAAAVDLDEDCALGYWGQAMTYIHPLWPDVPGEALMKRGLSLTQEAAKRQKNAREQAFIAAVAAYYADGLNRGEAERLVSFEQGWDKAFQQFPDDPEALAFYALSHIAIAGPDDKTYENQKRAGALVEKLHERIDDHPGAHHYIIHAYDLPSLAHRALGIARSYGKIAPDVPHALHMPTHIFTRLGLWPESISWNIRSGKAARKHPVNGQLSMHYLHAADYLAYAYLQQAQDKKALAVVNDLKALKEPLQVHGAAAYTLAAVPARYAMERQDWVRAAALPVRQPADFPWNEFPAYEALTHFARAIGAARTGSLTSSEAAVKNLTSLHSRVLKANAYWAKQVDIQRTAAMAWLSFAREDRTLALDQMRKAVLLEASTQKHAITPGEILPARELMGDMLMAMERPERALESYELSLERSPNRFNSLYGAARAAQALGKTYKATTYYRQLVEMTKTADTPRKRLQHARAFLGTN